MIVDGDDFFPSVKFPELKMCECKKNDKYQVWLMLMMIMPLMVMISFCQERR